jgi:hypothetical protein
VKGKVVYRELASHCDLITGITLHVEEPCE